MNKIANVLGWKVAALAPTAASILLVLPLMAMADARTIDTQDYTPENTFVVGNAEGPAVDKQGNLFAVNFGAMGTIGVVDARRQARLFVTLLEGMTANGLRFDRKGQLYAADYTGHNVLKIDPNTKAVTVLAHSSQMNQPNDIAITKSGMLYASDPNWKESTGKLWRIDPQGGLTLLDDNMGTTNGVEVSHDEKHLYVNESVQRKVWQYDLDPITGNISNKRLLIEFPDFGLDGMRCDSQGNLYIARYGAGVVAVVSAQGKWLKDIKLKGQKPTNVAFGGKDGKTLFVTIQDRGNVEFTRVNVAGREWLLNRK